MRHIKPYNESKYNELKAAVDGILTEQIENSYKYVRYFENKTKKDETIKLFTDYLDSVKSSMTEEQKNKCKVFNDKITSLKKYAQTLSTASFSLFGIASFFVLCGIPMFPFMILSIVLFIIGGSLYGAAVEENKKIDPLYDLPENVECGTINRVITSLEESIRIFNSVKYKK